MSKNDHKHTVTAGSVAPRPIPVRALRTLTGSIKRYPYLWTGCFFALYSFMFWFLENAYHPAEYHIIHTPIDDLIPVCEYFIIPYLIWFPYWILPIFWFAAKGLFRGKPWDFDHYVPFLAIGMSVFVIVSLVWPTGLNLRPDSIPQDNVFAVMLTQLWQTDSPDNVLPSVHVYNTVAAHCALLKCQGIKDHKALHWMRPTSWVICFAIIVATLFLRQHSIIDVLTALALAYVAYGLVYRGWLTPWARRVGIIDSEQ